MGSLQALETIKTLLYRKTGGIRKDETLIGRLFRLDAKTFLPKLIQLVKDDDCAVCSQAAETIVLPRFDVSEVCALGGEEEALGDITAYQLIDVRETSEWQEGRIPGAWHWPLSRLREGERPQQAAGLRYLIYCQSGVRSRQAITLLGNAGWDLSAVRDLPGGFGAWAGSVERDR